METPEEVVIRTSQQLRILDAQRAELAKERRRAMWKLTNTMSLAQIANLANMHRGAVHKDLARHPEDKNS